MRFSKLLLSAFAALSFFVNALAKQTCLCPCAEEQIARAEALASRILPASANKQIVFKHKADSVDSFTLSSKGNKIFIEGNNAGSMAVGLNHYLKYYCHVEVSWFDYEHFQLPSRLPKVKPPVSVKARVKDRFFLNYCTFGYTMPWWTWKEWEHFIDWMALNGVNMALAITGQESVWYKVWSQMGLTDTEIRSYFSGPAHLPWHRMTNLDGWGGPLPKSWLDSQEELQKKIVSRERELGIRPILPAFAGHVPAQLKRLFPEAPITKLKEWEGFPSEYACSFLDPMSDLFTSIQSKFIEEQQKTYGTSHIYGIDPFNEVTPPSWEADYLERVSRQIYGSVAAADPQAIWLQMGWIFTYQRDHWTDENIKAYLGANPAENQIILDYYCENTEVWPMTESFFGTPFIWCYLGNFGGNPYMDGSLRTLNSRFENTLACAGDNLSGIGCTLEGMDTNPYIYQYILEKAWDFEIHKDIDAWTDVLSYQRTGVDDPHAKEAWHTLMDQIYVDESSAGLKHQIELLRPVFKLRTWTYSKNNLRHDIDALTYALGELLKVPSNTDSYNFDLCNITRQMLMCRFSENFRDYEKAVNAANWDALPDLERQMLLNLDNLQKAVSGSLYFSLGLWLDSARKHATTPEELAYYEINARNLITTWSPGEHLGLNDYARRAYAELIETYYKPRWELFFSMINQDRETFDYNEFTARSVQAEVDWWEKCPGTFHTPQEKVNIKEVITEIYNYYSTK